ncbi:MAG: hypothetical protein P1V51_04650 [Deltaproteobacteria bacterium]|nr:hypothetical protein [Deltaproteobacteria bacterium]
MRKLTYSIVLALFFVATFSVACDPREPIWQRPLATVGPLSVEGRLVFLNRTTGQVIALSPETGVLAHAVGERPRTMVAMPGGVGVIAGTGDAPLFDRIDLADGARDRVELPAPYDRIWVSPSGAHALLTFDPNAPQAPGAVPARNNNEVGVVELATGQVEQLLLQTESLAPREVVFSDDGALAAVLLDSAVALIDLVAEPAEIVTVPLRLGDGSLLGPRKGLFAPDGGHLYLRVDGSPDVLTLEIARGAGALGASVNFLFVPDAVALVDIARVEGWGDHVAALFWRTEGATLALLEASGDTSRGLEVQLSERAGKILDLGGGHLLACQAPVGRAGSSSRYVAAWSLETGRLDEDALLGTYLGEPRLGAGRVFFSHGPVAVDGQSADGAITVLRVEEDELRLRVRLSPVVLGGAGTLAAAPLPDGSLLTGVQAPRADSGAPPDLDGARGGEVAFLLPVSAEGQPGEGMVLDERVEQVGVTGDFAWALHPGEVGDVTLVPLADLQRNAARRYRAFLFTGLTGAEELAR